MKTLKLSSDAAAVIKASVITETKLVLPAAPRLAPALYKEVNKVIEAAGGTWNRGAQAHLFTSDPRERLASAVDTLVLNLDLTVAAPKLQAAAKKKELQAFYTPAALARRVVQLADVNGKWVLEPSCGAGALVEAAFEAGAKTVIGFDVDADALLKIPLRSNLVLKTQDFLTTLPPADEVAKVDRIVMNPPFTKGQDIKHVLHALQFLRRGGRLVAIMYPESTSKTAFLDGLPPGAQFTLREHVPAGAFKESGTEIATVIVVIDKAGA